jgi:archaellum component FlaC
MSTTFYISIASSAAFVISEILPFINDTKVNGILHTIKIFLENCKSNQVSDINTGNVENDSFIVDIKNEVNDIKTNIDNIKNEVKDIKNEMKIIGIPTVTPEPDTSSTGVLTDGNDVIVNIKVDVNDIKNDVNEIKANINEIKNMFEQAEIV